MIWYETFLGSIKPKEFVKETKNFMVDAAGRRQAKNSDGWCLYPTYAEARAALIESAQREVERAERRLRDANQELAKKLALPLTGANEH